MENFYITFEKNKSNNRVRLKFKRGKDANYYNENTFEEKDRDKRVVGVWRKYLDLELSAQDMGIFEREDFEILGDLLSGLIFTNKSENIITHFNTFFTDARNNDDQSVDYNIFLEFEKNEKVLGLAELPWEYITYKPFKNDGSREYINEPFLGACDIHKINLYRKVPIPDPEADNLGFYNLSAPLKILVVISEATTTQKDPGQKDYAEDTRDLGLQKKKEDLECFVTLADELANSVEIKFLIQPDTTEKGFIQELKFGQEEAEIKTFTNSKDLPEELQAYIKEHRHVEGYQPDIIHFIGHGQIKDKNAGFVLGELAEHNLYNKTLMSDKTFAKCIKQSELRPKLVILQTCNGGRVVNYGEGGGMALELLSQNIPFVIAMQNAITEVEAIEFTQTFYQRFLKGDDIGRSVTRARYILSNNGNYDKKVFGSPVLFTYSDIPLKIVSTPADSYEDFIGDPNEEVLKVCNNERCVINGLKSMYKASVMNCQKCDFPLDLAAETEILSRSQKPGSALQSPKITPSDHQDMDPKDWR